MRIPIPVILLLCAASAGVAFFLGRTSRSVAGDERQEQSGGVAAAPGLSAMGNAARAEGASNPENSIDLLDQFRDVYSKPFAKDRVSKLRKLVAKMDVGALREAWDELSFEADDWYGNDKWRIADAVIRRWLALDREGALVFVKELPATERSYASWTVAEEMAESDAESAIAFARGLDEGDNRQGALRTIIESVAAEDPEKAWAIILRAEKEKWSTGIADIVSTLLEPLAKSDPLRVLAMIGQLADPNVAAIHAGTAIRSLARKNPDGALKWLAENGLEGMGDKGRSDFGRQILAGWAESDPAAATRYAMDHPELSPDGDWVRGVASGWAEKDFGGAMDWIGSLDDKVMRDQAVRGLFSASNLISQPEKLGELLRAFPESPAIELRYQTIAIMWAMNDPAGSLAWADESGLVGRNADVFRAQVIEGWAGRDPIAAAAHLGTIKDETLLRSAAGKLARAQAGRDLAGASEWVASQLPGPALEGAVAGLASAYAGLDREVASAWLNGIPQGKVRDSAISNYVGGLSRTDSSMAWEWGTRIADPVQRSVALERVAENLLVNDPVEGAVQIRESSDLSAEAKWRLLERVSRY